LLHRVPIAIGTQRIHRVTQRKILVEDSTFSTATILGDEFILRKVDRGIEGVKFMIKELLN